MAKRAMSTSGRSWQINRPGCRESDPTAFVEFDLSTGRTATNPGRRGRTSLTSRLRRRSSRLGIDGAAALGPGWRANDRPLASLRPRLSECIEATGARPAMGRSVVQADPRGPGWRRSRKPGCLAVDHDARPNDRRPRPQGQGAASSPMLRNGTSRCARLSVS